MRLSAPIAAISCSGTEKRTLTVPICSSFITGTPGSTVSPAEARRSPTTPSNGAYSAQSLRFFLAISKSDSA